MGRGRQKPTHTQKHSVLGTLRGRISAQRLPRYPDEFSFRFDRRSSRARGMLSYRLVQQAVQIDHVTTKEIWVRLFWNDSFVPNHGFPLRFMEPLKVVSFPLLLFVEGMVQLPVATGADSPESQDPLCGFQRPAGTGYFEAVRDQVPARTFNDAGGYRIPLLHVVVVTQHLGMVGQVLGHFPDGLSLLR